MKIRLSPVLLAVVSLALAAGPLARAQPRELEIDVRSAIVDKPAHKKDVRDSQHSKVYGVLAVQLIGAEDKLVKPVDANVLLAQLHGELAKHGFTRVAKGQRPDVLLTVQYGRSFLANPYLGATKEQVYNSGDIPQRQLGPSDIAQAYKLMKAGAQEKAQKAEFEKLVIRVTAWENPPKPGVKPKQLWDTFMLVDDPDHRDLNAVSSEMIAAGANFFDHQVDDPEVEIYKPLPEGHVDVGTPTVVEPKPQK